MAANLLLTQALSRPAQARSRASNANPPAMVRRPGPGSTNMSTPAMIRAIPATILEMRATGTKIGGAARLRKWGMTLSRPRRCAKVSGLRTCDLAVEYVRFEFQEEGMDIPENRSSRNFRPAPCIDGIIEAEHLSQGAGSEGGDRGPGKRAPQIWLGWLSIRRCPLDSYPSSLFSRALGH